MKFCIEAENIKKQVVAALDDLKAQNILALDVRGLTSITDYMVIASGTSSRHVKSLASNMIDILKKEGYRSSGMEGETESEWVLVDFGDVIVHVMLPQAREFYNLEGLWDIDNQEKREQV